MNRKGIALFLTVCLAALPVNSMVFKASEQSDATEVKALGLTVKDGTFIVDQDIDAFVDLIQKNTESYGLSFDYLEDNGYVRSYEMDVDNNYSGTMHFIGCHEDSFEKVTFDYSEYIDNLDTLKWAFISVVIMSQPSNVDTLELYQRIADNINSPIEGENGVIYKLSYTEGGIGTFSVYTHIDDDYDIDGASSDEILVKGVQTVLSLLNYDVGTPDGIRGPKTTEAIKLYQQRHGLEINGMISNELYNCIMADAANISGVDLNEVLVGEGTESTIDYSEGVPVNTFIEKYNDLVDYYNGNFGGALTKIDYTDNQLKLKGIGGEYAFGIEDNKVTGITISYSDTSKIDSNNIAGETSSLFYAFDSSLSSFDDALYIGNELLSDPDRSLAKYSTSYVDYTVAILRSGGVGLLYDLRYK